MARRRRDDPFGRVNPDGTQDIPFDRTEEPEVDPEITAPSTAGPSTAPGDNTSLEEPVMDEGPTSLLGGMMAEDTGTTDQMSDLDLASMQGPEMGADMGMIDPEAMEVEQLEAALMDPNTTPEQRAMIEQQIALAARRRMAGLGGLG